MGDLLFKSSIPGGRLGLSVSCDHRAAGRSPEGDRRTSFSSWPRGDLSQRLCGSGLGSVAPGPRARRLPLAALTERARHAGREALVLTAHLLRGGCCTRAAQHPGNIRCLYPVPATVLRVLVRPLVPQYVLSNLLCARGFIFMISFGPY